MIYIIIKIKKIDTKMAETIDYRKYLEEKFIGINDKLDNIHEQVLKTNSRVTRLEEYKSSAEKVMTIAEETIRSKATPEMLKELKKEIAILVDNEHLSKCPQVDRIKTIEDILSKRAAINMWVLRFIALITTLIGIIYVIIKIVESLS